MTLEIEKWIESKQSKKKSSIDKNTYLQEIEIPFPSFDEITSSQSELNSLSSLIIKHTEFLSDFIKKHKKNIITIKNLSYLEKLSKEAQTILISLFNENPHLIIPHHFAAFEDMWGSREYQRLGMKEKERKWRTEIMEFRPSPKIINTFILKLERLSPRSEEDEDLLSYYKIINILLYKPKKFNEIASLLPKTASKIEDFITMLKHYITPTFLELASQEEKRLIENLLAGNPKDPKNFDISFLETIAQRHHLFSLEIKKLFKNITLIADFETYEKTIKKLYQKVKVLLPQDSHFMQIFSNEDKTLTDFESLQLFFSEQFSLLFVLYLLHKQENQNNPSLCLYAIKAINYISYQNSIAEENTSNLAPSEMQFLSKEFNRNMQNYLTHYNDNDSNEYNNPDSIEAYLSKKENREKLLSNNILWECLPFNFNPVLENEEPQQIKYGNPNPLLLKDIKIPLTLFATFKEDLQGSTEIPNASVEKTQKNLLINALKKYIQKRQNDKRTYFNVFSRFFGGHSQTEKIEAAKALKLALKQENKKPPIEIDIKYKKALTEGRLGKEFKKIQAIIPIKFIKKSAENKPMNAK